MKDGRQVEVCGLPGLPLIYGTDTTRKEQKGCLTPMSFFDCGYAPYFFEAIRLKYPEFCREFYLGKVCPHMEER